MKTMMRGLALAAVVAAAGATPAQAAVYAGSDCSPSYVYSESRLLALHQASLQALQAAIKVSVTTDPACGQPDYCGAHVQFGN